MESLTPVMPPEQAFFSPGQESFLFGDLQTLLSPELVQVNRLPARATFTAFPDPGSARTASREESPWWHSLNGVWQAHLARRPGEAFAFLQRPEAERTWEPITVPGQWQMQGFWDRPHYTNIEMPFDLEPPLVPEENPTCVYRRGFRVPREWAAQAGGAAFRRGGQHPPGLRERSAGGAEQGFALPGGIRHHSPGAARRGE